MNSPTQWTAGSARAGCRVRRLVLPLVLVAASVCQAATSPAPYSDPNTAEGWAWNLIRQDKLADFNLRCDPAGETHLDSHKDDGWDADCRRLSPQFIVDILTKPALLTQIRQHGVRVRGSRIAGAIDLSDVDIVPALWLDASRIDGTFQLADARFHHVLSLEGTRIDGGFHAQRVEINSALFLRDAATVTGDVLLMGSKIDGDLSLSGSEFDGDVKGDSLTVGGNTFIDDGATVKGVLRLPAAKLDGVWELSRSEFRGEVFAEGLTVGHLLFARGARFIGWVDLALAHVGIDADFRDATAGRLDLSGASVGGELLLGGYFGPTHWICGNAMHVGQPVRQWSLNDETWRSAHCGRGAYPELILRNTHVGALQDSEEAWPPYLDLEGLTYDRLGGSGGAGATDMRQRAPAAWRNLLERDRTFSPQPYAQLTSVLRAAGHRDIAEAIDYAGRDRERHSEQAWSRWIWLTFLWAIAGYGVGLHTFRVLWWVLGLTLLGAIVLWRSPVARAHGVLWMVAASFHRLMPLVKLNKEFEDFFDNPLPKEGGGAPNLSRLQVAFFSGIALAGWVLTFFLLAALGDITPKG